MNTKTYMMTGKIAKILGKNPRQVARMIDRGDIKGKLINGRNGRARKSYRVVSKDSLISYIEEYCLDQENAVSWLLSLKLDDFESHLSRAEKQHGILGDNPCLARGVRTIIFVLRPDTSEKFDPLSKITLEKLPTIMEYDIKLRLLRANNNKK